ncbi:MAG: deoxyguanosinetriphosphate triphosphohydrolase family protein [Lachnospiraceae bacterium]
MAQYRQLSKELEARIREDRINNMKNPYAFDDDNITRREPDHDVASVVRPAFVRDVEKIMHVPYYNRYSDKTQVFSFYRNDDISRRALHVQLVARIARNIGRSLNLNEDLIEAIALGHDIGHTPFGHAGERILNELYNENTGRYFNHNVHSVRVLDGIVKRNISMETLDGIICHNGEMELKEYRPCTLNGFEEFDKKVEECYVKQSAIKKLIPATLEGCVVRISDIIAYLGKDRQDAQKLGLVKTADFSNGSIGKSNGEIINNLIVNIVENSYGKPYLSMDEEYFEALKLAKKENYQMIYENKELNDIYNGSIKPMFREMYNKLLRDAGKHNEASYLYKHHVQYVNEINAYSRNASGYENTEPNQMVVDYMASMTDDYFLDLYREMFPGSDKKVKYRGYFE